MTSTEQLKEAVENLLKEKDIRNGEPISVTSLHMVGGGSINKAFKAQLNSGEKYFVKVHHSSSHKSKEECLSMFRAEALGLEALRNPQAIRVPYVVGVGELQSGAFLVIEYIDIHPLRNQAKFGKQLAKLHLYKGSENFGFEVDNTIGSTPQCNQWTESWVELLRKRLEFQFGLAQFNGNIKQDAEELLGRLPEFFDGIDLFPSLVHGDLWSGNCASDAHGDPVIFDPATYWGHHESELGIMKMFGGFSNEFFDAYHEVIPMAPGFKKRQLIYELYHQVNHYNIFGSGYLSGCERIFEKILD